MGSPDFAAFSLQTLVEHGYNISAAVTAPDKPAGRGMALQQTAVKKLALANDVPVLQPDKLKSPEFIEMLINICPDLIVVVAFRMLPEVVFTIPKKGTINLHASLLPQYRGAAPINHAIINGENITGLTTFFIEKQIDTGKIIYQESVDISDQDNAGTLHDKLMVTGAYLLVKTINAIMNNDFPVISQSELIKGDLSLKTAPKIHKDFCRINWSENVSAVYDFIRGLSPYPGAFTELMDNNGKTVLLKVFETDKLYEEHTSEPGIIYSDSKTFLKIAVSDGYILIWSLQAAGKKRMEAEEFLKGFRINEWKIII